jgi:hypothetical protein
VIIRSPEALQELILFQHQPTARQIQAGEGRPGHFLQHDDALATFS